MKKTPLNAVHHELGAKMVDFGGWEMPVQYSGILEEHEAVRTGTGLFDVSHMGEFTFRGPDTLKMLQSTTCNDVSKIVNGRAQYNGLLYPTATFVDDLLVYKNADNDYFAVVNAGNIDKDFEWFSEVAKGMEVELVNRSDDYALLALQGPGSIALLQPLADVELSPLKYYSFANGTVDGAKAILSRTVPEHDPLAADVEPVPMTAVDRVAGPDGVVARSPAALAAECELAPELLRTSPI